MDNSLSIPGEQTGKARWIITDDIIKCLVCGFEIEREKINKFCANCVVCSGCEIYYCPGCDLEIEITPIKKRER